MWGMDEESFSLKIALKHAGFSILFVVALGLVALFLLGDEVRDPERMGRGVGQFAAFSSFGAFGASWAWQTGRPRLAKGLLASWVVLVVAVTVMVTLVVTGR